MCRYTYVGVYVGECVRGCVWLHIDHKLYRYCWHVCEVCEVGSRIDTALCCGLAQTAMASWTQEEKPPQPVTRPVKEAEK